MNWFINCYDVYYLQNNLQHFHSKSAKRMGIMDKIFNMVKGMEILLERQGDY